MQICNCVVSSTQRTSIANAAHGLQEALHSTTGPAFKTCDTLHVGNLLPLVRESQLLVFCSALQSATDAKVIRDKLSGMSAGYGFVKFVDHL